MTSISDYSVGSVKTFRGHDGHGYDCNLLRGKKKVAEILEDGWGGGLQFRWLDHNDGAVVHTLTYDDKPHSFNGTVEEALFYEQVMKLPKIPSYDDGEMNTSPDIVVDEMVRDVLITKAVKADLKKKVMIKTKDNKVLYWKITPKHTVEVLRNYLKKDHPEAIIINDMELTEAVQFYKDNNL